MAPLPFRFARSVPAVKSSLPKNLHFLCLVFCLASAFVVVSALPALAAAPPTGENAYCGKGNVAQFGAKDGPAELPKACYYTALDGTPSPGKQIRVAAKSDLATAIDGAKCADTLLLPAGASFDAKVLPRKNAMTSTTSRSEPTRPIPSFPRKARASLSHGAESPAFPGVRPLPNPPVDRPS
jgi:hypothetical protein